MTRLSSINFKNTVDIIRKINIMKNQFFKISETGFTICGMSFAAMIIFTKLQKKEIIEVPEQVGLLFLLLLSISIISFVLAFMLDIIEGMKEKRWSAILHNIGLFGSVIAIMYLWDSRLLALKINIMPWFYKAFITAVVVEAGAYFLSQKIR